MNRFDYVRAGSIAEAIAAAAEPGPGFWRPAPTCST